MDAVEEIKNRLAIEDVVGQYVQLKRAGRNWKGLSPYTSERTPSFVVSPEKQIWHDFSSGKGGDMFSFVMEMEGLDFKGALELLARKAGVDLEQYRQSGSSTTRSKDKERLFAALELATKFYQLYFSKNREAQAYVFTKRQFSRETAAEWRIGYSPSDGTALVTFLRSRGFTEHEIKAAGLSAERYRGMGDMFRGRIMIPLADPQGRIIGFTARLLIDDPRAPKYINTPQTLLYDKSRHIFGLHLAKEAIRKQKYAVVTEGNLDVIASHQAQVRQVVATAGTALTEQHLKALSRLVHDVRLSFDADNAGLNATERAIPIASKVGVNLSVITIPSGKDPDELIRQDVHVWEAIITKNQEALDWLIARYMELSDLQTQQGRKAFKVAVLQSLQKLESSGEKALYAKKIADILGYSEVAIQEELRLLKDEGRSTYVPERKMHRKQLSKEEKELSEARKLQDRLIAIAFFHPTLRPYLEPIKPQMILDETAKKAVALLLEHSSAEPDAPSLLPLKEYGKMLLLLYEELYQGLEITELQYEAARLQANLIDRYVKTQKLRIAKELETAEGSRYTALLDAARKLDALLKKHKTGA